MVQREAEDWVKWVIKYNRKSETC